MSKRPGGKLIFEGVDPDREFVNEKNTGEGYSHNIELLGKDIDFIKAFKAAVPSPTERRLYIENTSQYNNGFKDCDWNYVLMFRRTLPAVDHKPEERWSDEFILIRNGLKREIPAGPHRLHSVILCDTLANITKHGFSDKLDDFTDGEVIVNYPSYDQASALLIYKPKDEIDALKAYMQTPEALGLRETLAMVTRAKIKYT